MNNLDSEFRVKMKRLLQFHSEQMARVEAQFNDGAGAERSGTFSFACQQALNEYYGDCSRDYLPPSAAQSSNVEEAILNLRVEYKNLQRELQREHALSRQMLISLHAAEIMKA